MCNDDGLLESRAIGLTHPYQKTNPGSPWLWLWLWLFATSSRNAYIVYW